MKDIFLVLLAAHAVGDFALQTSWMARSKESGGLLARQPALLLHVAIHALVAYVFLQQWGLWLTPVAVLVTHYLVDLIKPLLGSSARSLAWDQALHVIATSGITWLMVERGISFSGIGFDWMVLLGAFSATVFGSGYFIGRVTDRMLRSSAVELPSGLKDGGKMIGQLERALIFILIFIGQPMGIGFLVAAKSVLRFEEAKRQQMAEYVLIGTLWSFTLAITISWGAMWCLGR